MIPRNDGGIPINDAIPLDMRRAYWKARSRRSRRMAASAKERRMFGAAYHFTREAARFASFATRYPKETESSDEREL